MISCFYPSKQSLTFIESSPLTGFVSFRGGPEAPAVSHADGPVTLHYLLIKTQVVIYFQETQTGKY